MSKSLAEITQDYGRIFSAIIEAHEADENDLTALKEQFSDINLQLKDKVDAYTYVLDKLKTEEMYWKERAKKARSVAKSMEKGRDWIKYRIQNFMETFDAPEVLGNENRFKLQKTPAKLIIEDEMALPDKYKITSVVVDIDKPSLKSDLKSGEKIPGAKLETGTTVRSYVNRKALNK